MQPPPLFPVVWGRHSSTPQLFPIFPSSNPTCPFLKTHKDSTFPSPFPRTPISSPLPPSGSSRLSSESGILGGINEVNSLGLLKSIHAKFIKTRKVRNSDSMAKNLISNYFDFGDFRSACVVFFVGFSQNYASWNNFLAEIENYGGDGNQILRVFRELHSKGVVFDGKILTMVLKVCTLLMENSLGLEIHGSLVKRGMNSDVHLNSALMNFYGRSHGIGSANQVFDEMQLSSIKANASTIAWSP